MKKIRLLLERMEIETAEEWGFERALWHLLKAFEKDLPDVNDYFPKAFRRVDVTEYGHVDMAIWQALQESKVFWRCFESVQEEKTTKEVEDDDSA